MHVLPWAALVCVLLLVSACRTQRNPAQECAEACALVRGCDLPQLAARLDCDNGCTNLRTQRECPHCLSGVKPSCEDIVTLRECGMTCAEER